MAPLDGWDPKRARAHLVFLLLLLLAGRLWVHSRAESVPSTAPPPPPAFSREVLAGMSEREKWVWGLPMDLSRATEEDLRRIPGVGPDLAGRIMAWIRTHGVPPRVDALAAVKGVGAAKLEALKRHLAIEAGE